ncbi:hypothetical protein DUGA2_15060 [Duganella sp. HH101]|nr:hypothetical protein DUGA2_15060 [Duganella sp. HH101]
MGGQAVGDLHLEGQLLLLRQRFEQHGHALDHMARRQLLGHQLQLARLDLGNVEDVVDQVEQIVAGRIDGVGEAHLLLVQVAGGVFRQQLGQDQRAVERCAQLVRHIRQELRFVLAGALQLGGALLQVQLRLAQRGVLLVQRHALLGQLLVGLLQLGLLVFQAGLRFLQHARLFFQFLVGGAQLFLLHLQFLVELLGLGQHFLQALARLAGVDGVADVALDQVEELDIARADRPQQAQLDHAVDFAVVVERRQQHAGRRAGAQAGRQLQITGRHLVQADQAALQGGLGHQALGRLEALLAFLPCGAGAVGRHAAEAAVVGAQVQGAHRHIQVARHELQQRRRQLRQTHLADALLRQLALAGAQPGLLRQQLGMLAVLLQRAVVDIRQSHQLAPAEPGQDAAHAQRQQQVKRRHPDGDGPGVALALLEHAHLIGDEGVDLAADLVELQLAAARLDRLGHVAAGGAQPYHFLGVQIPLLLLGLDDAQAVHLQRIVRHQRHQRGDAGADLGLAEHIRFEEGIFAGQQVAAHAGFHVHHLLGDFVGAADHAFAVLDPVHGVDQIRQQHREHPRADHAGGQR